MLEKRESTPTSVILDEDGAIGKLYGDKTTPHMFVIASDGTLVYNGDEVGGRSFSRTALRRDSRCIIPSPARASRQ